jgi:hypothetical protein
MKAMVNVRFEHRMDHSITLELYVLEARLALNRNMARHEVHFRKIEVIRR